jgi:hypothetical protein
MQHHINRLRSLVSQLVLKAPDFPGNVEMAKEIGDELNALEECALSSRLDDFLAERDSTPTIEVAASDLIGEDDDSPTLVNANPFNEMDTTPTAFIPHNRV